MHFVSLSRSGGLPLLNGTFLQSKYLLLSLLNSIKIYTTAGMQPRVTPPFWAQLTTLTQYFEHMFKLTLTF